MVVAHTNQHGGRVFALIRNKDEYDAEIKSVQFPPILYDAQRLVPVLHDELWGGDVPR